jgi:hypothetical protein
MNLRTLIPIIAIAFASYTQPDSIAENKLRAGIISTADKGMPLDFEKTKKPRKMAELVITQNKNPNLLLYNPNLSDGTYQGVQAVMSVDGKRYTVWVANEYEGYDRPVKDMMSFWIRPEGTTGIDSLVTFSDQGLDGNCDFGVDGKRIYDFNEKEGMKHRKHFQQLYEETVDKLLEVYKNTTP